MDRDDLAARLKKGVHRSVLAGERVFDRWQERRDRTLHDLRIVTFLGHGTADRAIVRGRVVNDPEPAAAVVGEGTRAAVRRMVKRFLTDEVPGAPVSVTVGDQTVHVLTDDEGYFEAELAPGETPPGDWLTGTVELAEDFGGVAAGRSTPMPVRVPDPTASFGVISDIDDTILRTGAQRMAEMVRTTVTGSALTRTPFEGASELYRGLERGPDDDANNPFFYVSSSPWNLYGFLVRFLEHRGFPLGPLLLRDLGVDEETLLKSDHGVHKHARIREVLDLHPDLRFVLIGDTGQHDPEIYAEVARRHPDRIAAIYLREVRLDPGDGRVEAVAERHGDGGVPFVLAADSIAVAEHAAEIGLLSPRVVDAVRLSMLDFEVDQIDT